MKFTPATRAVRAGIDSDPANGAVIPPITCRRPTASTASMRRRGTTTPAAAIPREMCSQAPSPISRAVREQWSRQAEWLPSASSFTRCSRLASDCWRRTIATAAAGGCSARWPPRVYSNSRPATSPMRRSSARRLSAVPGSSGSRPRRTRFCELPTLKRSSGAARDVGALTVADNTFLSPALQRPIEFGADVVVHSTTKYINGHSDVVGGVVVARDPAVLEQFEYWANALGVTGAPFDSYLTLRGLRTLNARLRIHQENAAALAQLLANHPAVVRVHYPGLAGHPGHDIAARQQDGFGAMLSVRARWW